MVEASAPGSLMLFGEHAVLRGRRAIVGAVDRRMTVRITPRDDDRILLRSDLGGHETRLDTLDVVPPFTFLLAALRDARPFLSRGCEIDVLAGFSSTVGLGSSAAVSAAALGALARWTGQPEGADALLRRGLALIRRVQGLGSGSDLAASVHGGLLAWQPATLEAEPLPGLPPFSLVYSGAKEPTPKVVGIVQAWADSRPELARELFELMGRTTEAAVRAMRASDWRETGALMTLYQGLMDAIGLAHRPLGEIITTLRAAPGVLGVKISGSGLGDCAMALGIEGATVPGYTSIPARFSVEGLRIDGPGPDKAD